MASPSTTADELIPQAPTAEDNYLTHDKGILSWLFTLDHKRIGVMYLISVMTAFALGGTFALLIRTELLTPGRTIMSAETYNQMFTLHGAVMVFLVIIPGIPAALGNFILPLQLGAKDVAFPRLNLMSYHLWIIGALFLILSMVLSAADTGWTFYTPYSTTTQTAVIPATFGAFILGFSSIFTGLNFIVTIHKLRPPGMTWFRMPLFLWGLYSTAVIQVLATPVLGITLLMLIAERAFGIGIFDPALGGDPVLYQHFFWFYSHPAVYIMIVPAFGVISEIITVFSRKRIFGYKFIALSSIADRHPRLPGLGTPPVRERTVGARRHHLQRHHVPDRDPHGDQDVQLAGDHVQGVDPPGYADALRAGVPLGVHHRRSDRRVPRGHERRRASARHVLRRRPLPLRDDGRLDHGVPRRSAHVVAQDVRAHVQREGSAASAPRSSSSD